MAIDGLDRIVSFLPMKIALQVFNCYILPIITYGLAVWWDEVPAGALEMIDEGTFGICKNCDEISFLNDLRTFSGNL